jgi:hypothetical protein
MVEQTKWRGLWICPDGIHPINDKPPFIYKCQGMKITQNGADAFMAAFLKIICERN